MRRFRSLTLPLCGLYFAAWLAPPVRAANATSVTVNSATPNPALLGQAVSLSALVTPPSATGVVTFFDGATPLGTSTLSGGQAALVTRELSFGRRSVTAHYGGDASNLKSASPAVTVSIGVPPESGLDPLTPAGSQGEYPSAVAIGDFNNDGVQDLAIANLGSDSLSAFLGNGDGTFTYACTRSSGLNSGSEPTAIAVADFNGDGRADLAVANQGESTLSIFLGNGDGTFQETPYTYPVSANPQVELYAPNPAAVIVADFNGDGLVDVATANFGDSTVSVLLGKGDGTLLASVQYAVGSTPNGLAAADFNGDGLADLAIADADPDFNEVYVMLGASGGGFHAPVAYPGGLGPIDVAAGDFNNDGKVDLVIADAGDYINVSTGGVTVLLGSGTGAFTPAPNATPPSVALPNGIAVGDLNGDGILDVVLTDENLGLSVLYGQGDGSFSSIAAFASGSVDTPPSSFAVAVADLNGDSLTDVAVVNQSPDDDSYAILLGIPGLCSFSLSVAPAVFDASGGSSSATLTANSPGCSWSANGAGFLTAAENGIGSAVVPVAVQPNSTGLARVASISIGGQSATINQWGTVQAFTDVPITDYYFDGVDLLKQTGVTTGCGAATYCPSQNVTRAQMAVFLVRAIYGSNPFSASNTPYFQDVPPSAFGFADIQKLYELGITTGCGVGLYCPNNSVTRDQMAVFLIRARLGSATVFDFPGTPYFTDVPSSFWAFRWIQRLKMDGVTSGCGATTYCPGNTVTRGDMALFLMRGLFNQLLPAGTAVVSSVSPTTLARGQSGTFTVTGVNTAFVNGQTVIQSAPGITVGAVIVTAPGTLSVELSADPDAAVQPISLLAITGAQEAVLPNGITIE